MKKNAKPLFWLAFIIYLVLLIKITILRIPFADLKYSIMHISMSDLWDRLKNMQYMPFENIVYHYNHSTVKVAMTSFAWIMLWLIPMGYFVPLLTKTRRYTNVLILGLLVGLFIEVMQLLLNVSRFSVDDVILSGMGITLGYVLYKVFK